MTSKSGQTNNNSWQKIVSLRGKEKFQCHVQYSWTEIVIYVPGLDNTYPLSIGSNEIIFRRNEWIHLKSFARVIFAKTCACSLSLHKKRYKIFIEWFYYLTTSSIWTINVPLLFSNFIKLWCQCMQNYIHLILGRLMLTDIDSFFNKKSTDILNRSEFAYTLILMKSSARWKGKWPSS